jgi:hypothetical protein
VGMPARLGGGRVEVLVERRRIDRANAGHGKGVIPKDQKYANDGRRRQSGARPWHRAYCRSRSDRAVIVVCGR